MIDGLVHIERLRSNVLMRYTIFEVLSIMEPALLLYLSVRHVILMT